MERLYDVTFAKAKKEDKEKVLALYRAVRGGENCTWNEYYPTETEFYTDIEHDSLFAFWKKECLIATASVVAERELDGLSCWKIKENVCEIARLAVTPDLQGQGIALKMLLSVENVLREQGTKAVHLLVAKKNVPAMAVYRKAGYSFSDSVEMYGNFYFACEKILSD